MDHSFSIIKSTNEIILEHKYFIPMIMKEGGGIITISENKYISIDFDGKIKKQKLEDIDNLNINDSIIIGRKCKFYFICYFKSKYRGIER